MHFSCNTEARARTTGSQRRGLKPCDGCPSPVLHSAVLVPTKALLTLSWPASVVPLSSWAVGDEIVHSAQEVLRNTCLMNKFNATVFPHSHCTTCPPSYTSWGSCCNLPASGLPHSKSGAGDSPARTEAVWRWKQTLGAPLAQFPPDEEGGAQCYCHAFSLGWTHCVPQARRLPERNNEMMFC